MKKFSTSTNLDVEQAVLGAVILDPECVADVMTNVVHEAIFCDELNRSIYAQCREMYSAGENIDVYTLLMKPKMKEHRAYVISLTQKVGSGANVVSHVAALNEYYVLDSLALIGSELTSKALQKEQSSNKLIALLQQKIDNLLGVASGGGSVVHVSEVLDKSLKQAEQRQIDAASGKSTGVPTGLFMLDNLTGGFKGGELIVIAARPGMGKTALMLHLVRAAAWASVPPVVFSLEMSSVSLVDRMLLSSEGVNANNYKIGKLSSEEWKQIELSAENLRGEPIMLCDDASISMLSIKSKCQQLKAKGKLGIVFIDYLQLLEDKSRNSMNREQEIAKFSRQAKVLAKELEVPVVLLSQLSREVEKRTNKQPVLSDLRESGAIEQDADMVMFIHRPALYGIKTIETNRWGSVPSNNVGILTIAKQRNGKANVVMYFNHSDDLNRIDNFDAHRL